MPGPRVQVDCRRSPNAQGCTVAVAGTEQEVFDVMLPHLVGRHGMQDNEETRNAIRSLEEPV